MAGELQAAFHQRRPGGGKDPGTGASGLGGKITIEGPPVYNPPRDGKLFALARRRIDPLQLGTMQYAMLGNLP